VIADRLFARPSALARFHSAPLAQERERYLQYCADRGHDIAGLKKCVIRSIVIGESERT
jgi:hypothetical protein